VLSKASCKCSRHWNPTAHSPNQPCAGPSHALKETAPVNPVVIEVMQSLIDQVFIRVCHLSSNQFLGLV
jgi:hypothetical protein